jgi:hypothetical protein
VVTRQEAAARQTAFAALAMLDLSLVRDAEVPKAVANMGLQPREQNALLQRLGVPAPTPIPTEADAAHAPAVGNPPEAPAARAAPAGDPPAGAAGRLPGAQPAPSAQPAPRAQTAASAQAAPLTQPGPSAQAAPSAQSGPSAQAAPSAQSGPSARPAPSAQPAVRETARLSLAWITLWDTDAEDGDVVRIDSGGYSRTITLSKQPVTIAVPVPHDSVISVTGIRDGEGGGITVGLASGASRAVFPIMSVGQTLGLRAQFN